MTVINTNIKAMYTQAAIKVGERESTIAMQQLSTGKRVNSSKDDAAGLAIAARMTQNIKGLNQAIRNGGDAISLIQVAESATNEITAMFQRMSELAVQSSNSTYSSEQRGYLDQEFQQLKQEIVRISETHEWNGFPILNGKNSSGDNLRVKSNDLMPSVYWSQGAPLKTEFADVFFKPLEIGQSVTVAGLTYTAKTLNTAQDVAKAFTNLKPNIKAKDIDDVNSLKGTFTGILEGFGTESQVGIAKIENRQLPTYIEFFDSNRSSTKISLKEDTVANVANAAISILKGKMYLGDGVNANLIGQVDPTFNGSNGTLRFNFIRGFGNQNFDSGLNGDINIEDWESTLDFIRLNGTSILAGYPTITDMTSANGGLEANSASGSVRVLLSNDTSTGQGLSVNLKATFYGVLNTSIGLGSVAHGPALTSKNSVLLNAGDVISFDWRAAGGIDTYDVSAYLINTKTGNTESLLDKTGGALGTAGFATSWTTRNHTISTSGSYRLAFVTGSWDSTADGLGGAALYIDNINIQTNSPIVFNETQIQSVESKFELTEMSLDIGKTIFTSQTPNSNVKDLWVNSNANDALSNTAQFDFRVGANKDQVISLNIADFGKDGPITGLITNDKLSTNILTIEASNLVVKNIDTCLDKISMARANMGAVINRLQHVIDNLSNVVVNSEASRSQIEDADYAQASTLLAQTQIKQQAATAVLAQANVNAQMVLKLLEQN